MMSSGTAKPRRKIHTRSSPAYEPRLTTRDHNILSAIASYRLLTSVQLSRLFWPPSLSHKLRKWGVDDRQAGQLLALKSATDLDQIIELLKWLIRLSRIRSMAVLTSPAQKKVASWLRELEKNQPADYAQLDRLLREVARMPPAAWLLAAVEQGMAPPAAYFTRPETTHSRISRACTQRLRLLYDAGYLEKVEQATRLGEGRSPAIYFLSRKGRDYLARLLKQEPQELYRLELVKLSDTKLPHFIKTNDIRIALTLDAEQQGFEIVEWRDDLTLRRFHSRSDEKVTVNFEGRDVSFGVIPDGYFWLRVNAEMQGHFFVECDLATVVGRYSQAGAKDWRRKVLGYGEYYKTRYSAAYPEARKSLRLLVVTTGQGRLDHLRSVTQKAARQGAHRYWFTTFDRLNSGSPLVDKIWERADQAGLHSIV